MIAGLLLAAGRSRRFGSDKLLASLRGRRVIRWSAESVAKEVDRLYVVTPPGAHELARTLGGLDVVLVEHIGRDGGIGTSLAAGVTALDVTTEAVVVALADQPLIDSSVIARLCEAWRASGKTARAVAPMYRDGRGHPVLFSHLCFEELRQLRGDNGAKALLESMGDALVLVPFATDSPPDVDTREALAALS